jgi:ketosteroid isomerase-like protein
MDTTSLLQAIYKALRERRLADAISYLAEDFHLVVHLPEEAMPGGNRPRSKAESTLLFQSFLNDYDLVAYDHGPIIVAGDRATTQPQIRYRHKKTGRVLDTKLSHTWSVKDGKAVALEERYDVPVVQAFLKSLGE